MEKKKTTVEKTDLILIDSREAFEQHLNTTKKVFEIADYGDGLVLTLFPFKRVPIRVAPLLDKNTVALYEKHLDGYGQIKRWNYIEKGKK